MQAMADDLREIKAVKYRYLRALDTKDWDTFADTLTDDVVGNYGSAPAGNPLRFYDRNSLVAYMRTALPREVITEHRVAHPELSVDGDEATGRWYLQDRVIVAGADFMLIGAAFYADTYRRTPAGWKISATGYDRTYEATMSTAGLGFHLTPGPALHE
jgi:hypothetical protein